MKTLHDYLQEVTTASEGDDMKPMKVIAEQNNEDLALWNTEDDRWSRRAKHPLRLNEIEINETYWEIGDVALFESQQVEITIPKGPNNTVGIMLDGQTKMVRSAKLTKISEGVMGGLQALNPINRIMQLAGLETTPVQSQLDLELSEETVETLENNNEFIEEADGSSMFDQLFNVNMQGPFKNNPDAARVATIGDILTALEVQIQPLQGKVPNDMLTKMTAAVAIGVTLIQTAKSMLQPTKPVS